MTDIRWSPSEYLRFGDERTRPARDLLAAVPLTHARVVVDLGCGPGNSTELLVDRFPDAAVAGVDTSEEMLAEARVRLPDVTFTRGDVATWEPDAAPDLVFANAVLQWVPDHLAVMERLLALLAPGGALAVQMPDNLDQPSHALMRVVASEGPWAARFADPILREAIHAPAVYVDRLQPLAASVDVWHTIYTHPLADAAAVVAMVRSTGLRPFLARLDASEQATFLAEYEERIAASYPRLSDGRILFRFPRLFVVAVRR